MHSVELLWCLHIIHFVNLMFVYRWFFCFLGEMIISHESRVCVSCWFFLFHLFYSFVFICHFAHLLFFIVSNVYGCMMAHLPISFSHFDEIQINKFIEGTVNTNKHVHILKFRMDQKTLEAIFVMVWFVCYWIVR